MHGAILISRLNCAAMKVGEHRIVVQCIAKCKCTAPEG
jgi:hypothetical protein